MTVFHLFVCVCQDSSNGFYNLIEGLIEDIFKFGTLMPRLAKHHNQPDYLSELDEIAELSDIRDEILSRVSAGIAQVRTLHVQCIYMYLISVKSYDQ